MRNFIGYLNTAILILIFLKLSNIESSLNGGESFIGAATSFFTSEGVHLAGVLILSLVVSLAILGVVLVTGFLMVIALGHLTAAIINKIFKPEDKINYNDGIIQSIGIIVLISFCIFFTIFPEMIQYKK